MGIILLYGILFLLLSNAVTTKRDKSILYNRIAIILLVNTCFILYETLSLTSLAKGVGLFGGLFHSTALTSFFQFFIYSISGLIIHLTAFYPRNFFTKHSLNLSTLLSKSTDNTTRYLNIMSTQYKIIEYPLILLFIITGASFLTSSSDIVSIFLSIELQSYGLYLVCSLYRNSELSTSAGLTYFLLGGLSSCFILLGTSLLYVNSGTTNLDNFYIIINLSNILDNSSVDIYGINYLQFSLLIMSIGFLFKISAAPFHFWSPDVYDAIPTVVTTFVAIIAKISILIFLLELIHFSTNNLNTFNWTVVLLYSSLLSLIIGSILGLNQYRIKRLFAYSTISHLGFILLALSINSIESIQAFIFYLMQYSLTNLNAFILLIAIGYNLFKYINKNKYIISDENNSPVQLISQLKGYYYINPLIAISFCVTIYSFVGIPPLVGFFAKQMVLSAALTKGYIFITLIAILTSVISAVYYLGIVKQIFFDTSDYEDNYYLIPNMSRNISTSNLKISSSLSIIISILTFMILFFMLSPQEWLSLTNILAILLFNL